MKHLSSVVIRMLCAPARAEFWNYIRHQVLYFNAMGPSVLVDNRQSVKYPLLCRLSRGHMKKTQTDLLQGTLDLLVLKTLQAEPTHGWDIAQRVQQVSQDVL